MNHQLTGRVAAESWTGTTLAVESGNGSILGAMRMYALLFTFIALVLLVQFLIYVIRGPVDPVIASVIFAGFVACLAPALFLLKPFESREETRRRQEARRRGERQHRSSRGSGDRGA